MSIAQQAARGVAWNMLLGVGARVVQLAGTLVLARLIDPDAYGEVIAASILVITAGMASSYSFGQYLIAKRASAAVASQAMVLHMGIGVVAMAVVVALRHPLGEFFGTPRTAHYVLPFAIAHLIDRARNIPERLLSRALRFRTVAAINATGELAYVAATLATAAAWGPDAIVLGALVRAGLVCGLFLRLAPRAEWMVRARLRAEDVRGLFSYGLPIMIGSVSDHLATRFDNMIIHKLFGAAVMARYNLAYSLAEMPVNSIASQIGDVLMPSFSRMEPAARRGAVIRSAALMSLVVSPLGAGLAAVSPTLVAVVFNDKWGPQMAPMLAILATTAVVRPLTWSAIAYLQSVQQTRLIMYTSFLRAIVVLALVALFGALGDERWACVGAGIGFALHSLLTIVAAGRAAGFAAAAYLLGVARPLLPCALMYAGVVALARALAAAGVPQLTSLVAQVAVGAVVYAAAAAVLCRPTARELVRLARTALGKRRGAGAG
jgi:PST family polysaccharide transporter